MIAKCYINFQELTQKEAEYVSLSRDTTETDLKQRREILSGTAYHIDQVLFQSILFIVWINYLLKVQYCM